MPRQLPLALAIAVGATALAACTAASGPTQPAASARTGRACFLASQVNSYGANRDGTVDIRAGASRYFRLTPGGGCPDINWSMQVGIRSTGGSDFVCSGYDAEFIVPDPSGTQRCPIASIVPITRAEYDAAAHR